MRHMTHATHDIKTDIKTKRNIPVKNPDFLYLWNANFIKIISDFICKFHNELCKLWK